MILLKTKKEIINFANVESIKTNDSSVVYTTTSGKKETLIDLSGWFGIHDINEESTEFENESAKDDYDNECQFAEDVLRYILIAMTSSGNINPDCLTFIDIEHLADICFRKEVTGEYKRVIKRDLFYELEL